MVYGQQVQGRQDSPWHGKIDRKAKVATFGYKNGTLIACFTPETTMELQYKVYNLPLIITLKTLFPPFSSKVDSHTTIRTIHTIKMQWIDATLKPVVACCILYGNEQQLASTSLLFTAFVDKVSADDHTNCCSIAIICKRATICMVVGTYLINVASPRLASYRLNDTVCCAECRRSCICSRHTIHMVFGQQVHDRRNSS
jgi:hypothetical protein